MRFYTKADALLVAALTQQRDMLLVEQENMKRELSAARKELISALDRLTEAKAAPLPPKPKTQEEIRADLARHLHIPESVIDEIDFERLGMQVLPGKRHQ